MKKRYVIQVGPWVAAFLRLFFKLAEPLPRNEARGNQYAVGDLIESKKGTIRIYCGDGTWVPVDQLLRNL